MAKNASVLFVLSLALCCWHLFPCEKTALGQLPSPATAQAMDKGARPDGPTYSCLIHRRYLRIPNDADSMNLTVVVSVASEEVKRFSVSPTKVTAEPVTEVDMAAWMGAVAKIELFSDEEFSEASLFSGVSQSNKPISKAGLASSQGEESRKADPKGSQSTDQQVSFAFEIQPLLSEKCYACHGPDSKNAESDLKLSDRESAIDYGAFIAGDIANSEAIARIVSDDESLLMPPPESHKPRLTESELALLKRWIQQGAKYEKHWAFTKLQPVDVEKIPSVAESKAFFVRNPIDTFVHRRLIESGLSPSADEAPHRLIRRLSFDLTGLPPSPEMVTRYVENPTEEVYGQIVDELLASHHYGEHWTLHWLDAVRYADTHGIHIDNRRAIWPYRDWVIDAFNNNQPFDEFTVEQIAGDMLPEATMDQKVASGYNRCLPTTSEGGVIDAEVAVNNANDQTASTFAVWQGLTVGCAACHDHKFDPVSQKEYYQLTAFFRNNEMKAKDGNVNAPPPVMPVPSEGQAAEKRSLEKDRNDLEAQFKSELQQWQTDNEKKGAGAVADQLAKAADSPDQIPDGVFNFLPKPSDVELKGKEKDKEVETKLGLFGSTPVINKQQFIRSAPEVLASSGRSFSCGGFIRVAPGTTGTVWSKMFADDQVGWDLSLNGKAKAIVRVVADPKKKMLDVITNRKITDGKWHHVFVVMDGQREDYPLTIYIDGAVQSYSSRTSLALPKTASFATEAKVVFGRRDDRGKGGKATPINKGQVLIGDFHVFNRALTATEVKRLQVAHVSHVRRALEAVSKLDAEVAKKFDSVAPEDKDGDDKKKKVFKDAKFAKDQVADLKATQRRLLLHRLLEIERAKITEGLSKTAEIDAQLAKLKQRVPLTLVMRELKNSTPKAHILDRGDYASPTEEVTAGVPAVLPSFKHGASKDRLGLAGWMVSPENPLTARVTANRYWYYLFGTGIVESTEDFGVTGSRPSHPQLLNWLAAEFVENDWDVKQLLRTIVTSSTYRQSQTVTAEKKILDPDNRLLSRGPRVRLDGEQLRDMALQNSGLLVDKLGGPPVKPYQPAKIWQEVSMAQSDTRYYRPDSGDGLYRRSLYTFWKRTAAPPTMTIMNSPDRDVFCVRRERTNTPLQAFVMWNDPQFVEAAKKIAERLVDKGGSFRESADAVGQSYLARSFSDQELDLLKSTHTAALDAFEQQPEKADALLRVGNSPISDDLNAATVAAWTVVVSQVMNLDEALMK